MAIQMSGRLLAWIIMIPGLVLAYFLGSLIAEENYIPIFIAVLVVALFIIYFGFGDKIWLMMPLAMALPFSANFLPLNFSFGEIATGLALVKFIVQYQALEKRRITFGIRSVWWPFFILAGILAVHMLSSGGGFRALGSEGYGGRKYLPIFFAVAAYLIILNTPGKSWKTLNRIPLYYGIATVIGLMPSTITLFFPSLTPVFFRLFGTANIYAYYRFTGDIDTEQAQRIGELSSLGIALLLVLVAYCPVRTWWHPSRWWALFLSLVAFVCVIAGGYRNSVFIFGMIYIVAVLIQMGVLRSVLLAIPCLILLTMLILGNNRVYSLPFTVQRTLSVFPVPGSDWDADVKDAAEMSDGFRKEISDTYLDHYFDWTLLGHGFNFDPAVADASMSGPDKPTIETFVIKKDFHVGWISLYDGVGIVGCIATIFLMFALVRQCVELHRIAEIRRAPIFMWVSCFMISQFSGYFTVFGSLPTLMNQIGIFASLMMLVDWLRPTPKPGETTVEEEEDPLVVAEGFRRRPQRLFR